MRDFVATLYISFVCTSPSQKSVFYVTLYKTITQNNKSILANESLHYIKDSAHVREFIVDVCDVGVPF